MKSITAIALATSLLAAPSSRAVLFYSTPSTTHNISAPNPGDYAVGGWKYAGRFGGFMATMIAPQYFITAAHIGTAPTFVHDTMFHGGATATYTVDSSFNGGVGYKTLTSSDLRIYKITGTFPYSAPLYTGGSETGSNLIVSGRGGPRGADFTVGATLKGWVTGGSDGVVRWGTNVVAGTVTAPGYGDLIYADFDAAAGGDESHLSVGDSGGAVFIDDAGVWKLAGINFGVDNYFDDNADHSTYYKAALFDVGGTYFNDNPLGAPGAWTLLPDTPTDLPTAFYSTRISNRVGDINLIIGVPEPGTAALSAVAALLALRRRWRVGAGA